MGLIASGRLKRRRIVIPVVLHSVDHDGNIAANAMHQRCRKRCEWDILLVDPVIGGVRRF